jgi:hypothetical protein
VGIEVSLDELPQQLHARGSDDDDERDHDAAFSTSA